MVFLLPYRGCLWYGVNLDRVVTIAFQFAERGEKLSSWFGSIERHVVLDALFPVEVGDVEG